MARKKVVKKAITSAGKKATRKKTKARTTPRKELRRASAGLLPSGYRELLEDLKTRVRSAQLKAAVAVNRGLIQLYWDIGRLITERQQREGWGQAVIERLADDVQRAFPGLGGFSRTNVFRMRAFFLAYAPPAAIVPQPVGQPVGRKVAQPVRLLARPKIPQPVGLFEDASLPQPFSEIPWGHNALIIEKVKNLDARRWYASKTIEHGWSRPMLTIQIETNLYGRQGKAVTNFAATLPALQSDLAQQTLKDPYIFDFLTIGADAHERELELGLIDHVQKFLQELGAGFAFVGRQFPIAVGDEWQTQLVQSLPEPLRSSLPTIEQIEEELGRANA